MAVTWPLQVNGEVEWFDSETFRTNFNTYLISLGINPNNVVLYARPGSTIVQVSGRSATIT